jgi:hypothetical protein
LQPLPPNCTVLDQRIIGNKVTRKYKCETPTAIREVMEESVYGGDYYTVLNEWKTTNAKIGKMNIFLSKISAQRKRAC